MSTFEQEVLAGVPHLITLWRKPQPLLADMQSFARMVDLLHSQASGGAVHLLGYCLLPDKAHLIVECTCPARLRKSVRHLQRQLRTPGSLRCRVRPLDRGSVQTAIRYVETEPVRRGFIERAEDFEWSSAIAHVWGMDARGVLWMPWWWEQAHHADWRLELERHLNSSELSCLGVPPAASSAETHFTLAAIAS